MSSSSRVASPHVRSSSTCSVCEVSPRDQSAIITATREQLAENLRFVISYGSLKSDPSRITYKNVFFDLFFNAFSVYPFFFSCL